MSDYEVTVYTTDGCGPCRATKAYLGKYEITFNAVDVTNNQFIREALKEQGHKSFPVVEYTVIGVESGNWSGHQSERLEALKLIVHG